MNSVQGYPYATIKTLHENCKNCTITQFRKQLQQTPLYSQYVAKFAIIPFPGRITAPVLTDTLTLHETVTGLTLTYLTAMLLSAEADEIFQNLADWADRNKDPHYAEMINLLINRVKGNDDISITSIAHLAYYEMHMYRPQQLAETRIILPTVEDRNTLLRLSKRMAEVLRGHGLVTYRTRLTRTGSQVVGRGVIDYLTDDALWGLRLRPGQPTRNDYLHLLTAYILITRSGQYPGESFRYLRILNPVEGITYSLDVQSIPSHQLRILEDCLYKPDFSTPEITELTRLQRARLVTAMVRLMDSRHQGQSVLTKEVQQLCALTEVSVAIRQCQESLIRHFLAKWSTKELTPAFKKGVLLLNRFYYYLDNITAPTDMQVTLSDALIDDILKKALDY